MKPGSVRDEPNEAEGDEERWRDLEVGFKLHY
jgi:hypothetical protein